MWKRPLIAALIVVIAAYPAGKAMEALDAPLWTAALAGALLVCALMPWVIKDG